MPTFLAGGTGTPKLLWGADEVYDPESMTVVANTGDDIEIGGLLVCPDIDSVLYERSDLLDRETWWGIENDHARTHEQVNELADAINRSPDPQYLPPHAQTEGRKIARWRRFSAVPEFLHLGDRDRAIHAVRTSLIDEGKTLTAAIETLAEAFDLTIDLRPMSDDPVATIIQTPEGEMHFQAFWVGYGGQPEISGVRFRGAAAALPTAETLEALADPVIIGPSNPITSIGPMLALDGVGDALESTAVVAVSPFIEDTVFSGPAAELLEAEGYEASTAGVAEAYDFVDAFVLDSKDETPLDRPIVRTDTKIQSQADATRVARATKEALEAI